MAAPQRRRPTATKRTERTRKADRKRELLGQAKHLFATLGYRQTTTDKIARAAGVAVPVFYDHFPNKQALFLEVLREVRAATVDRWRADTAGLTDPLAKLHAIADRYLEAAREHALEFRVLHRTLVEGDDPEIAAEMRSFYLDGEALLAQVISEGQRTGVFRRSLDPRVGAWEVIRAGLGYTLTLSLDIPLYQEQDYLPRAIECLLQCLLKTDV